MFNQKSSLKKSLFNRSRSSSNIPIRHSRTSAVRNARSSSISRAGSMESVSHIPKPSTSKVLSASKRTPLNTGGSCLRSTGGSIFNSYRKTLTCSDNKRCRSKSPRRTVDARPVNDKDWLKDNRIIVQNYIAKKSPELAMLVKPDLTINTFINITQLLLEPLDARICLTSGNYITEVPNCLKMFGYPGVVTVSLMKTVNIKRSWPQVLAIWAWLVENLNILENHDITNVLKQPGDVCAFKMICKLIGCTAENNPAIAEQKKEEAFKEFANELFEIMPIGDIDKEALEGKRKFHAEEEAKVTKKRQILDTLKVDIWNLEQKIKEKQENAQTKKLNLERKLERKDAENVELQKQIDERIERVRTLKNRVETQKYTVRESKLLDKEIAEIQHRVNLNTERREARIKEHDEFDFKIAAVQKEIVTRTFKLNDAFVRLGRERAEIKQLMIPEAKLHGDSITDVLSKKKCALKTIINSLKQDTAAMEAQLENNASTRGHQLQAKHKETEDCVRKLEAEILSEEEQSILQEHDHKKLMRKLQLDLEVATKDAAEMKASLEMQDASFKQDQLQYKETKKSLKAVKKKIHDVNKDWAEFNELAATDCKNIMSAIEIDVEEVAQRAENDVAQKATQKEISKRNPKK